MTEIPLPYSDERHQLAHQFLVEEVHLLDCGRFDEWLALVTDDVEYLMPVRVTATNDALEADVQTMDHFAEDHYSLRLRVERFASKSAWAEDPRSRQRHHVTNVRAFAGGVPDELRVESGVLLFRSRGDQQPSDLLSAGRVDTLRRVEDAWRLARRIVTVDEAVLRTQNLAVFL
ncbi:MAG: 3-phenylpropionate/cinnamic acid dioxygenase subunit beta [Actinomycetota bacterium]|jgi:phthalate 3,4-dioxygenase subunit beta|nr:3-phenylpropionate/cinnamic acid dioxygenase subunit beta [Actinomycetota bacterium]